MLPADLILDPSWRPRIPFVSEWAKTSTKRSTEMKRKSTIVVAIVTFLAICAVSLAAAAEKPIIIGAPLATAFLYGWDAERGIKLAAEEINAAGGVKVGDQKRPFQVEVIDTRDLEPGVPTSDALLALEKLILERKADFIIGGPVRSEAALAAMPLLSKYKKISILTTGSLTPKYNETVAQKPGQVQVLFPNFG